MNTDHPNENELLQFAAGDLDEVRFEQIAAHLEHCEQCGDVLRKTGAFPKLGVAGDVTKIHQSISEGPGSVIGPYKLLQQLGEGGMGVVYMAQQERPVRRMVALKIIKPGMDNGESLKKFRFLVNCAWRRWLRRRHRKRKLDWDKFNRLLDSFPLPPLRVVHSVIRNREANV